VGKEARRRRRLAAPRAIEDVAARLAGYERIAVEELGGDCWRRLDRLVGARTATMGPDWCWSSMSLAAALVPRAGDGGDDYFVARGGATLLWHLGAWRKGRSVYLFDPALAEALVATDGNQRLPVDILHRLPAWGCYLVLPRPIPIEGEHGLALDADFEPVVGGCFVSLDWDGRYSHSELRILLDVHAAADPAVPRYLLPQALVLNEAVSVDEAHRRALRHNAALATRAGVAVLDESRRSPAASQATSIWAQVLPLILYLCAMNADLTLPDGRSFGRHRPSRTGPAAPAPTVVHAGWRTGADLRRSAQTAARGTSTATRHSAPHLRRAHWHHYWTGPKRDPARRALELRWIPPTLVLGGSETIVQRTITPAENRDNAARNGQEVERTGTE
jgi:hypothetical protein